MEDGQFGNCTHKKGMLVVIRADASQTIGSGHIMRCLTLAERLRLKGAEVSFICRGFKGNLAEEIKNKGFKVHLLNLVEDRKLDLIHSENAWLETNSKSDAEETVQVLKDYQETIDWLIVDHYRIDFQWESFVRKWTRQIIVIDDLANRKHDCDILLDQNYYCNLTERYEGLVSQKCTLFLGPRYLLLRDEFYNARRKIKVRSGKVSNILIFYGGADATNETEKCLSVLLDYIDSQLEINVVIGCSNPNRNHIERICSSMSNVHYYCQISNMAELINKADLAFGAGGSAMWERCFLGLPSIVTITAENQRETTQAADELGAIFNLGWYEELSEVQLRNAVDRGLKDQDLRVNMHEKSLHIAELNERFGIEILIDAIGDMTR